MSMLMLISFNDIRKLAPGGCLWNYVNNFQVQLLRVIFLFLLLLVISHVSLN